MGKDFFQFKEFKIKQDKCAMKVCTDSCIMGASIVFKEHYKKILDIGAGTGLLSLMMAQKCSYVNIDAVEIDQNSANQCYDNFTFSPWKDRLAIFNDSIQNYSKNNFNKYDLIVCNPPFYTNNLKSNSKEFNTACHNDSLNVEELMISCVTLMKPLSDLLIMLPFYESSQLEIIAGNMGMHKNYSITIKNQLGNKILRNINSFNFFKNEIQSLEIIIKNNDFQYTHQFEELLKPFYTIFS